MILPELSGTTPWFVSGAVDYIAAAIGEDTHAFEWGAGGSTLWLAQRAKSLVTVEHDSGWAQRVGDDLEHYGLDNVTLRHLPLDGGYVGAIAEYPDESFDLIIVDGRKRAGCIVSAWQKLARGGIFIVDDSQRSQYQDAMRLLDAWERHDWSEGGDENKTTSAWVRR